MFADAACSSFQAPTTFLLLLLASWIFTMLTVDASETGDVFWMRQRRNSTHYTQENFVLHARGEHSDTLFTYCAAFLSGACDSNKKKCSRFDGPTVWPINEVFYRGKTIKLFYALSLRHQLNEFVPREKGQITKKFIAASGDFSLSLSSLENWK